MTPRAFWDRSGNLWELSADGWGCWMVWHHEHGEDFVRSVFPTEERRLFVGSDVLAVALQLSPLVASC